MATVAHPLIAPDTVARRDYQVAIADAWLSGGEPPSMTALYATVMALYHRERTGEGCYGRAGASCQPCLLVTVTRFTCASWDAALPSQREASPDGSGGGLGDTPLMTMHENDLLNYSGGIFDRVNNGPRPPHGLGV